MQLTISEIVQHCQLDSSWMGSDHRSHQEIQRISTDTRSIESGDLFFALKGDRFDGHDYAIQALQHGAIAAVVTSAWYSGQHDIPEKNLLVVDDTLTVLQSVAAFYRKKFDIPVLALTGSSGKTTTKEMISTVLSRSFCVHRNIKSFNNHIGVPLTLLGLTQEHDICVTELGTNHFGELKNLSRLVQPTMVLITNIGYAHLETFGSLEGVLRAKLEILEGSLPDTPVIYRYDDPLLRGVDWQKHPVVTFGLRVGADVQGRIIDCDAKGRYRFECDGESYSLSVPGRHMIDNALASIAIAKQFGIESVRQGIESFEAVDQRMQVQQVAGMNVILDYYNANPDSMKAALKTVADISAENGRKIAILADMLELGELSRAEHQNLAQHALDNGIQSLFLFGPEMRHMFAVAKKLDFERVRYYDQKQDLLSEISHYVRAGDLILIKGSRGMKLEDVWYTLTDRT